MYEIKKSFKFEAAHKLVHHDGKCARLHGHSFVCTLHLESNRLISDGPKRGMVADFDDVTQAMKTILTDCLDHHYLNETLEMESPTSEAIAEWLYWILKPQLPLLAAVSVSETCTSEAKFIGVKQPS